MTIPNSPLPGSLESNDAYDLILDEVMGEFVARLRRGEVPCVEEYTARHPEIAERLRDALPAVRFLERIRLSAPAVEADSGGPSDPGLQGPVLSRFGDYRLLRELGRGNMGIV